MSAEVIDGKAVAVEVVAKVTKETAKLVKDTGTVPGIAVVIVGEDPASQVYVRSKGKRATECGFHSLTHKLKEDITQEALLSLIDDLTMTRRSMAYWCNCHCPDILRKVKLSRRYRLTRTLTVFTSSMWEN